MKLSNLLKTFAFILILLMASCQDENELTEARVVGFSSYTCICCWGWTIEIGTDTIRTESGIVGNAVGYDISEPVSVYIELGKKEEDCSARFINGDFYEITRIKLAN